ncbi:MULTISPECIES: aromatic-ring-hydroxylating dioxygenase subunit beta [unclassified Nocardioides]|uniref:aromatic-ring-hydroxylating dioxygenase subunit beta n=1 Tax=unclassified Nocardioides TaxID=2615069 RepID=UPI0000EB60DE|nr:MULTISPECIES: aromatic-ring-hydroxylating dioxygenase subunit beta [unclassified Nocardioides]ABL80350.1 aromatic-ring-hydroxylating dioxygenase, beta subunit [Nocardioides sp. JS614]
MSIPAEYTDTSSFSYHVDADFYADLDRFRAMFVEDWPDADPADLTGTASFLTREARLIDEGRFNDWLELFSDDCLYWVPVTAGGGDPRTEVSHAFDDRRRLTDRVYWLRTGLAYSQIPASRTRRLVGNVEVLDEPSGARLVRSNFIVNEFRAGVTKTYAGWYAHVLTPAAEGWRIRMKQANLLDSEQYHENLTIVF